MEILKIVLTILEVIASVALIAVVMLQSGKSAGLSGAIGGAAETFFGKNKARSLEAKLQKMTVGVSIAFFALTAVLAIFG